MTFLGSLLVSTGGRRWAWGGSWMEGMLVGDDVAVLGLFLKITYNLRNILCLLTVLKSIMRNSLFPLSQCETCGKGTRVYVWSIIMFTYVLCCEKASSNSSYKFNWIATVFQRFNCHTMFNTFNIHSIYIENNIIHSTKKYIASKYYKIIKMLEQ